MTDAPAFTPSPIRFRVWDGETMHCPDDADLLCGDGEVWNALRDQSEPGSVVLLSTGLRDAEGVEVFEGDLLMDTLNPETPPVPVYRAGACLGTDYAMPLPDDLSRYRVVGNVYQHEIAEIRDKSGVGFVVARRETA